MSIESDLKKDGIEVVRRLDTLSVNSLAHDVAEKVHSNVEKQFSDVKHVMIHVNPANEQQQSKKHA